MTEPKFTPGPWETAGEHLIGTDVPEVYAVLTCIADVDSMDGPSSKEERIANAYLIAAAPDLYQLAKQAQQAVLKMARKYGAIPDYLDNLPFDEVLAKARGEQ